MRGLFRPCRRLTCRRRRRRSFPVRGRGVNSLTHKSVLFVLVIRLKRIRVVLFQLKLTFRKIMNVKFLDGLIMTRRVSILFRFVSVICRPFRRVVRSVPVRRRPRLLGLGSPFAARLLPVIPRCRRLMQSGRPLLLFRRGLLPLFINGVRLVLIGQRLLQRWNLKPRTSFFLTCHSLLRQKGGRRFIILVTVILVVIF